MIHGVAHRDVSVHSWDYRGGFLKNALGVGCEIHPAPVCGALSVLEEQKAALAWGSLVFCPEDLFSPS